MGIMQPKHLADLLCHYFCRELSLRFWAFSIINYFNNKAKDIEDDLDEEEDNINKQAQGRGHPYLALFIKLRLRSVNSHIALKQSLQIFRVHEPGSPD